MSNPDEKSTYTYQDWLTWNGAWELINGKAYNMSPAPTAIHQYIVGELYFALRTFFQNRSCFVFVAPFDVRLSENGEYEMPDHIVQPLYTEHDVIQSNFFNDLNVPMNSLFSFE